MLTLRLYVILIFLFFPEDALIRSLSKKLARAALPHNFGKAQDGNILVLAGLTLPLVVGLTGLGTDTIQWTLMRQQLQRSADSAALNGAYAKAQRADVDKNARADLTETLDGFPGVTIAVQNAPVAGKFAGDQNAVKVVLGYKKALPFSSLFLSTAPTINVEATAAVINNGDYCLISLEDRNEIGINISGSATLDLGCGMFTNATAINSVNLSGTVTATATTFIGAVGDIANSSSVTNNLLQPFSLSQRDPYASLAEAKDAVPPKPNITPCNTAINVSGNASRTVSPGCYTEIRKSGTGDLIFSPGNYQIGEGGIELSGTGALTMGAGDYYIDGDVTLSGTGAVTLNAGKYLINGNLYLSGTQNLTTNGVTLVMNKVNNAASVNNDKGNFTLGGTQDLKINNSVLIMTGDTFAGNVTLSGTQPIQWSPPTTGDYKGITIYVDRRGSPNSFVDISGTQSSDYSGAVYAPASLINISGTGRLSSTCLNIVSRKFNISGTVGIASKCVVGDDDDNFKGRQVRLVE
jgi:Putative Flp pilus-assembly TadE/G-like